MRGMFTVKLVNTRPITSDCNNGAALRATLPVSPKSEVCVKAILVPPKNLQAAK
jgi:hypothetical protein